MSADNSFEAIYKYNLWITGSGTGSLYWNNLPYIRFLERIIEQYDIGSIIEIGCGDCRLWEYIRFSGNFLGIDIVDNKISPQNRYFNKYIKFNILEGNINDLLLNKKPNLIIIKDLFVHLSNNNIEEILKKIDLFHAKYLVIAEDSHYLVKSGVVSKMININEGMYRPIDLQLNLEKLEADNYYEITYLLWVNFWIVLFFIMLLKRNFLMAIIICIIILLWIPKKEISMFKLGS